LFSHALVAPSVEESSILSLQFC